MESKTRTGVRALLAGALVSAALAAPTPASAQPLAHPQDDVAGSQIAKHEGTGAPPLPDVRADDDVLGLDVGSYQGNVDWPAVSRNGGTFVYVKATEGVTYTNPNFAQQYNGSYGGGPAPRRVPLRLPEHVRRRTQANYFVTTAAPGRRTARRCRRRWTSSTTRTATRVTGSRRPRWSRGSRLQRPGAGTGPARYPTIYTSTRGGQNAPATPPFGAGIRCGYRATARCRHAAGRLGLPGRSGSSPTRACSRATRTGSTATRTGCARSRWDDHLVTS